MQKRLLVAVDESLHARNALLYAAGFYSSDSDLQLTLMNIRPIISLYLQDQAKNSLRIKSALEQVKRENETKSQQILKDYRELLIRQGIKPESIETVSQARALGLARDIIEYGHSHGFDAIVAGRRGLSRIQKVFMGSTSAKLMEHTDQIPIWIVDGQVLPRRLLVAVDFQVSMSPLMNHIRRMCIGMDSLHLTFFHVFDSLFMRDHAPLTPGAHGIDALIEEHEQQEMEKFWDQTRDELIKAGMAEQQLAIKYTRRNSAAGIKTPKMIIEEVKENPYDTVVMGRTGAGKAFFFGSVSRYVSERLTDHAIWLIS